MHDYTGVNSYPATISLIDDTDAPIAANFNTEAEGLANRTTYLKNRLGAYYIVAVWEANSAGSFVDSATFTTASFNAAGSYATLTVPLANLEGNDFFVFEICGALHAVAAASTSYACQLTLTSSANGAGYAKINGSEAIVQDINSLGFTTDYYWPFSLHGTTTITSTVADFKVGIAGQVGNTASCHSVSLSNPWHVRAIQYRSTT